MIKITLDGKNNSLNCSIFELIHECQNEGIQSEDISLFKVCSKLAEKKSVRLAEKKSVKLGNIIRGFIKGV